ncbi:type I secretion system permease/ATPase [Camelimonas abortus]|uniref:Type I secretion system permease/ATPase n=1 Tax=Camelimonas abortus TaxID=1017184 RepID=A0ABV7LHD7_9HYPH
MTKHLGAGAPRARPDAVDTGLAALCAVAGYYRISLLPEQVARRHALSGPATAEDVVRAARAAGLKARAVAIRDPERLRTLPFPAIIATDAGRFVIFGGPCGGGAYRLIDPVSFAVAEASGEEALRAGGGRVILVQRRLGGPGQDAASFGFRWFAPSLWRYRRPLAHVLLASLFIQIFALVTPLFFQVVVDKVLAHRSHATLAVLVAGLAAVGLFDAVLQYLRAYALTHTASRIDVELGQRLVRRLLSLPLSYFDARPAGQTVARIRELETIRAFLTGQGLFAGLDLVFTLLFLAVLFAWSATLAWIVVASIPLYVAIGAVVRPLLKERVDEKFRCGALSQQLLVESVVGMQTLKAAAEPLVAAQWEERLAAYVRASFSAAMLSAKGQGAIQYVSRLTSAALLLFGARAVISGEMSVGALVAFNMIAGQVAQPVLRLSQLWQDFQQVQVSVARLADILNAPPEPAPATPLSLPPPRGAVSFRNVTFGYAPGAAPALKDVTLDIRPGEMIGVVGPSGSGKSTLTRLVQRFYIPDSGQVLVDGVDISRVDPAWLRAGIGVVLQDSLLFNRTIHENIALCDPAMSREAVTQAARLAAADGFIARLQQGYDTLIEERGANLSGGQRQRIAIARALAARPRILIFDEATSALDYESERVVLANMREIARGRTVIIIAHRLAAVRFCHRIIGMEDGRVVEEGTHAALLARGDGPYARLWRLQHGEAP